MNEEPHLNVVLVPETVCDCYRLLSQFCECSGVLELSFCCCYEDAPYFQPYLPGPYLVLAVVPQDPKYCNLNRTINALWLRQPHYNPLFTGTTEVDVRRWDGSSALSHWASADCAISVLPRAHNVPYFPAGVSFFVPFQCTIPSSSSVTLPTQNRRTHLQSI